MSSSGFSIFFLLGSSGFATVPFPSRVGGRRVFSLDDSTASNFLSTGGGDTAFFCVAGADELRGLAVETTWSGAFQETYGSIASPEEPDLVVEVAASSEDSF